MPFKPPKLPAREMRTLTGHIELRTTDKGPSIHMMVPYNSESEDLGGFREVIRPGAFTKTLREQDIVSLWNHDPNWVLGRMGNKTLDLRSTDTGLEGDVQLDPTNTMHVSFAASVKRGDVKGTSFGFEKIKDSWEDAGTDGTPQRALLECRLYDVSPVTFPAYPESAAEKRSSVLNIASVRAGIDLVALADAIAAAEDGHVALEIAETVRGYVDRIVAMLPVPVIMGPSDEDRLRKVARWARIAAGAPIAA